MTKEEENHPLANGRGKPETLDYARGKIPGKSRRKRPKPGTLAFVGAIAQIPWSACMWPAMLARCFPGGSSGGSSDFGGWIIFYLFGVPLEMPAPISVGWQVLPSLVGFAFGCYSLKVAGMKRRNILGIIGLLASAIVVVPPIFGFSEMLFRLAYGPWAFVEWAAGLIR